MEANLASIFIPRYLSWSIPAAIIGSVVLIDIFPAGWIKLSVSIALIFLTTKFYISNVISNNFVKKDIEKNMQLYLTDSSYDQFGWKEAILRINNSGLQIRKIYIKSGLIESEMLNKKNERNDSIYKDYLLSPVNAIYKLKKEYLEIAEAIPSYSKFEIPDSISNYMIVGGPMNERDLIKGIEMSPKQHAIVNILYFP